MIEMNVCSSERGDRFHSISAAPETAVSVRQSINLSDRHVSTMWVMSLRQSHVSALHLEHVDADHTEPMTLQVVQQTENIIFFLITGYLLSLPDVIYLNTVQAKRDHFQLFLWGAETEHQSREVGRSPAELLMTKTSYNL